MYNNQITMYYDKNRQYKTSLGYDSLLPCRFKNKKVNGLPDIMARFIEKIQLLDVKNWELFSKQFYIRYDSTNNGWRGEYWGKMMRGACITYSYTHNKELYYVLRKTVLDILNTQDDLGRISSYSVEKEYHGWDIWCRKYIILGLLHFIEICTEKELKNRITIALEAHLDYIIETIGDGKVSINETSELWGCANSVSLLEPVVLMYNYTGKEKYLDFAKYIIKTNTKDFDIFEAALDNINAPYQWDINKAYEIISCFEGLIEFYRATGINKWKTAAQNFIDSVRKTDVSIIGCCGCYHEIFNNSTVTQTDTSLNDFMQETCVTVTWIKFCYQFLRLTGESIFADEIEKSIYNAFYGSINTEQTSLNEGFPFDSYSPLRLNKRGRRVGGAQYDDKGKLIYGCCAAIGSAGTGLVPEMAVSLTKNGIALNLYMDGQFNLVTPQNNDLKLIVNTQYPSNGDINISFVLKKKENFELLLRIPEFSKHTKLFINNDSIEVQNGYTKINRIWNTNDNLFLKIDMAPRVIHPIGCSTDINSKNFIAVKYGPIVLARDLRISNDCGSVVNLKYDENDNINLRKIKSADFPTLCEFEVPCINNEFIKMIDYQSAGKTWDEKSLTEVWLPTK